MPGHSAPAAFGLFDHEACSGGCVKAGAWVLAMATPNWDKTTSGVKGEVIWVLNMHQHLKFVQVQYAPHEPGEVSIDLPGFWRSAPPPFPEDRLRHPGYNLRMSADAAEALAHALLKAAATARNPDLIQQEITNNRDPENTNDE